MVLPGKFSVRIAIAKGRFQVRRQRALQGGSHGVSVFVEEGMYRSEAVDGQQAVYKVGSFRLADAQVMQGEPWLTLRQKLERERAEALRLSLCWKEGALTVR